MRVARSAYDAGLSYFRDGSERSGYFVGAGRTGLGLSLGDITGAISNIGHDIGVIAGSVTAAYKVAQGAIGGGSTGTSDQKNAAEQARTDSYVLGLNRGSVLAAQYLLGQHQSSTSSYAQNITTQAINTANIAHADIMQQAQAAGMVHDSVDGLGGLQILDSLHIQFTDPGAGCSTTTGLPGSVQAQQLAAKLRQPQSSGVTIPGTGVTIPAPLALVGGGLLAYVIIRKL